MRTIIALLLTFGFVFCAAAAVMVCAIGAALLQLAVMILSFSSPIAITVIDHAEKPSEN